MPGDQTVENIWITCDLRRHEAHVVSLKCWCVLFFTRDYRALWVQWSFSFIKLGTGAEVGHNLVLEYDDSNLHYVSAIAMVNEYTDSGWELLGLEGMLWLMAINSSLINFGNKMKWEYGWQYHLHYSTSCHWTCDILYFKAVTFFAATKQL